MAINLKKYINPNYFSIKKELAELEKELNNLIQQKIELEQILSEFEREHAKQLGTILLKILKLRHIKYQNDEFKSKETQADKEKYEDYLKQTDNLDKKVLTTQEQREMKKQFRKAVLLCHPDKVQNNFKDLSKSIFIELKNAYDQNDNVKVNEILSRLKKNDLTSSTKEDEELNALKMQKRILESKIQKYLIDISSIKSSETYDTIKSITDWSEYFNEQKKILIKELELMENSAE